jgi:outer membrane lipoprotein-sorting protein
MRKTVGWAIIFMLLLSVAGCGQSEPESSPQLTPEPPATEETVAELLTKGKNVSGMTYDMLMTSPEYEMTGKVWVAGTKVKMEMETEGQKVVSIVNPEAGFGYTYMPDQNIAMKVPISHEDYDETKTPQEFLGEIAPEMLETAEVVMLEGVKCYLLSYTEGEAIVKLWVHGEYGVPVKAEFDDSGVVMTIEYKNMQLGEIPDETFTVPEGVQVMEY